MKKKYTKLIRRCKKMLGLRSVVKTERNVASDWFKILGLSVVTGVVLSGIGVHAFFFGGAKSVTKEEVQIAQSTFDSEHLSEILGLYRARSERHTTVRYIPPDAPKTGLPENISSVPVNSESENGEGEGQTVPRVE